jgi:hypothetical protein
MLTIVLQCPNPVRAALPLITQIHVIVLHHAERYSRRSRIMFHPCHVGRLFNVMGFIKTRTAHPDTKRNAL